LETEKLNTEKVIGTRFSKYCRTIIDPKDVLLLLLHIKLGLTKQFVKTQCAEGECFQYLRQKFLSLNKDKIKGDFVGFDIRKLMKHDDFVKTMTDLEKNAWIGFKKVMKGFFLGNKKKKLQGSCYKYLEKNFFVFSRYMALGSHNW